VIVSIRFDSQVRRLAGCSHTTVDVDEAATLIQIIERVADQGTESLRTALLDEAQVPRSSLLVFLNDELVAKDQLVALRDGAELTLTTLISGG